MHANDGIIKVDEGYCCNKLYRRHGARVKRDRRRGWPPPGDEITLYFLYATRRGVCLSVSLTAGFQRHRNATIVISFSARQVNYPTICVCYPNRTAATLLYQRRMYPFWRRNVCRFAFNVLPILSILQKLSDYLGQNDVSIGVFQSELNNSHIHSHMR